MPRFSELLNATKDPKASSSRIFFNDKPNSIEEFKNIVNHNFVELTFSKISKNVKILMDKDNEPWYELFELLYSDESWYKNLYDYENCISIDINMDTLFEYKLTMKDIAKKVSEEYDDLCCVFSPDSIGRFDIFVFTDTITLPENRLLFIDKHNAKEIYLEEVVLPIIEKMIVAGIKNIENIYYIKEGDEWILETDGNNFNSIITNPLVNESKTVSNNVWDIYNVFGIEAAKNFLVEELNSIMEGVNNSHTKLLAHRMTFPGTIASISRYTLRKSDEGLLSKISFEESFEQIVRSSFNGETENTEGVSAAIICGKRTNIGSGMMDLHVDAKMLVNFPFMTEVIEE